MPLQPVSTYPTLMLLAGASTFDFYPPQEVKKQLLCTDGGDYHRFRDNR